MKWMPHRNKRYVNGKSWHEWFAWYPINVHTDSWERQRRVWLEKVLRKRNGGYWEYKTLEEATLEKMEEASHGQGTEVAYNPGNTFLYPGVVRGPITIPAGASITFTGGGAGGSGGTAAPFTHSSNHRP